MLDTILDPVSMMGLNLFKDEQTKKLQEKADLEALVQSLQNQIKETKNLIEVIDLGNKLVFKEYQKMGNENTVSIRTHFLIRLLVLQGRQHLKESGEFLSKNGDTRGHQLFAVLEAVQWGLEGIDRWA